MRDVLTFYKECFRMSISGLFKKSEAFVSGVTLLFGVIFLFIPLELEDFGLPKDTSSVLFLIVFAALFLRHMALSPYNIYKKERDLRLSLEEATKPKLKISLRNPQGMSLEGVTSESISGHRFTTIRQFDTDAISILCENISTSTALNCNARIKAIFRERDRKHSPLKIIESIKLPWDKENPEENLSADIPPFEKRRIWIGVVRTHGHFWIFRDTKKLPVEYHQVVGDAGTYFILIQIDGENISPYQIVLKIVCEEGPKPENGIWRGKVQASIVAEGSSQVDFEIPVREAAAGGPIPTQTTL